MAVADDGVFVGRDSELAALHRALADARAGEARLVVVEGDPGIGKTALLRRFVQLNPAVSTVWVSGDETETALRFGVADQLRAALAVDGEPGRTGVVAADAFAVGAELIQLIGADRGAQPLIVVIDDLHWADQDSGRALLFWLRRLRQDCVLVMCGARPHVPDVLGESWARLIADRGRCRLLRLGGLSAAEIAELAGRDGAALPPGAAERLRAHTAGNPLYVSSLLAELPAEALHGGPGALPAPHSYAATVLARIANVSAETRALIAAAAVLGARSRLTAAAAVAGITAPAARLDEAVAQHLLDTTGDGAATELLFPHPLVRAAVYDDLSPASRRRLHLAAARVVPAGAATAHRVAAADGSDPALAAELAAGAESALARGLAADAAQQLIWSAELEPVRADADERLLRAVELLLISGDVAGGWRCEPAVRECGGGSHRSYVLGALAAARGELVAARDLFEQIATPALAQADARLYAQVSGSLALVQAVLGAPRAAVDRARRALAVDAIPGHTRSIAAEALALGLAYAGRVDEALGTLASASNATRTPAPFEPELVMTRGRLEIWAGDWAAARTDLRAVIDWANAGYSVTSVPAAYAFLADAEFRSGDWDNAVPHIELATSLGQDLDHGWYLAYSHELAAALYVRLGDEEFAQSHATAARRAAAAVPHPVALGHAAGAEAAVAAGTGAWDRTLAILEPLLDVDPAPLTHPALHRARTLAAQALVETGQHRRAGALLDRPWLAPDELDRCRLRARLHTAGGDPAGALRLVAEAAGSDRPHTDPFAQACLRLDHADLLTRAGDRPAALAQLQAARATLTQLNARPLLAVCDAALTATGQPAASESRSRLDGLTRREQVVARLVGQGLTNREIAAQLYVSGKTIEYHVANIFTKMGISSRRELWRRTAER